MSEQRRARAPEAKEDRRRQLCDAARAALDVGTPYADVTMAEVSRRAGLAKGTSYLYFPSKEALFLEVLTGDLSGWFDTLAARAAALPAGAAHLGFAEALADTLLERPRMLRLLGLLHVVIEANLDVETACAFKTRLGEHLLRADAAIGPSLPGLGEGDVARLLLRTHALIVGLGPMSTPPPAVAAALADPARAWLRVDFRTELVEAVAGWLRGWRAG
ncbi:MAG: TetR family transcriptional regulator [Pseudomonadota bacterium]|nr:TetR family transcriptional regulator [Pseudomonadota bacterium]